MTPMHLVFVGHCHPDTPHVCGTRTREFAEACARAGHRVVLLTETLYGHPAEITPAGLAAALDHHDWDTPFRLACAPVPNRLVAALREGRIPALLRQPLLAFEYLSRGGVFTDWRDGSQPYWPVLAEHFRPQAVWATFGNTDAWAIAQGLARLADCPWVMDLKDPWSVFIPRPLRRILPLRFSAAAATALSAQHATDLARWFHRPATVVYSGIETAWLAEPKAGQGTRRLLVLGGLYDQRHLDELMAGIQEWNQDGLVLTYAGSEIDRFRHASRAVTARIETPGYLDAESLACLAADSMALLYIRNPNALYQHKLIELLALDRPVLCLPDEAQESLAIAAELGATFRSCANGSALAQGLAQLAGRVCPINRTALARYTWDCQAEILLEVLRTAKAICAQMQHSS